MLSSLQYVPGYTGIARTDAAGNDIKYLSNVSQGQCKDECNAINECKGFNFSPPFQLPGMPNIGNCFLKNNISNAPPNNDWNLYIRDNPPPTQTIISVRRVLKTLPVETSTSDEMVPSPSPIPSPDPIFKTNSSPVSASNTESDNSMWYILLIFFVLILLSSSSFAGFMLMRKKR
jgi:hypothetical protein